MTKDTVSLKNQSGQTLIIIIMIMLVALTVGVTMSNRFISTLKDVITTDDTSKALAISEAAIEKLLVLPYETLEDYVTFGNCGSDCILTQTDVTGQQITANVTLSFTGNSSEPYPLELTQIDVSELKLQGYSSGQNVEVCWDGSASIYASYVYNQSGNIKAQGYAYNSSTYSGPDNDFSVPYSANGYQNCFAVTASNTPLLLRVKSVYSDTDAVILPAPGQTLPAQGISLVSVGSAGNARKTVSVTKSSGTLPSVFDYVLYQKSTSSTLSN